MEVDEDSQIEVIQRQFGYSEILWKIENYFSAICDKEWIIYSPEFCVSGRKTTKWRLFLKPKYKKRNRTVFTYLERLKDDTFTDAVRAKWKLNYPAGRLNLGIENTDVFEKSTSLINQSSKSEIAGIDKAETYMRSVFCNVFTVHCKMFVYNEEYVSYVSKDLGLKCLSQDLAVLCRLGKQSDVTLFLGQNIFAHKAVLCKRNDVLKTNIQEQGDTIDIDFAWIRPKVAQDLVSFLYTGNLDYVLRMPSFAMHDLIDYWNVVELKNYFMEDVLTICTSYGMQEFNFLWPIDVDDIGVESRGHISSPEWRIDILNVTFRLTLFLKHFDSRNDHVALYGQFIKGTKPMKVYIECSILDGKNEIRERKHLHWNSADKVKLGFESFFPKSILKDSSFHVYGNLTVRCTLHIPTGTETKSIITSKKCTLVNSKKNEHFEKLSMDMGSLFETGEYSDFTIVSGVIHYRVHKSILKCRSHILAKKILDARDDTFISIPEIDSHTLRIILVYIYTGKLKNYELDDIKKVYLGAEMLSILSLKYTCSEILQENIKPESVLEILVLANKCKDFKLKLSIYKFMFKHSSEIRQLESWDSFADVNSPLFKEFAQFMKKYIPVQDQQVMEKLGFLKIEDYIKFYFNS